MKIKRTAMIHVRWPEEVKYFILNGDYNRLHSLCVNVDDGNEVDELTAIVESHLPVKLLEVQKAVAAGDTALIETGWVL